VLLLICLEREERSREEKRSREERKEKQRETAVTDKKPMAHVVFC
jgi:hypothetical protein